MAELRQLSLDGKRIKEAVEKVEDGTVYEAGEGITIDGHTISGASALEAGIGIDITEDIISTQDYPIIVPNTVLTDEQDAYVRKGLPIKILLSGDEYLVYHFNRWNSSDNTIRYRSFEYYVNPSRSNFFVTIYSPDTKKFTTPASTVLYTKAGDEYGGVKVSTTVQSQAVSTPSAVADRTYPIQLDSNGYAVVNVPWESGGSSTTKYLHHLALTVNELSTSTEVISGVIYCDIINTSATLITQIPSSSVPAHGLYARELITTDVHWVSATTIAQTAANTLQIVGYYYLEKSGNIIEPISPPELDTFTVEYSIISDTVTEL